MTEQEKDTQRIINAVKTIYDGRDPNKDFSKILVTLEGTIAALLIQGMKDPRNAALMLNEGLVPGVENRLSIFAARLQKL